MDVLSDVVTTMKTGRPKVTRARRSGRWGSRFGPYPGAGFHVVLSGDCWLIPPEGSPLPLTTGDVVFLPHGAAHGVSDSPDRTLDQLPQDRTETHGPGLVTDVGDEEPAGDQTVLLCGAYRLNREVVHPFLRGLPQVIHLPAHPGRQAQLRSAVELLSHDAVRDRAGSDAALPALLDLLIVYALRAWLEQQCPGENGGWCAALTDPAVAAALDRMHREPARAWSVRSLAASVGLSRSGFATRFSSYVGQSPMAYLAWWRLSTAARLLREGDAPLAAVARQVGYGSASAFANAFKREFGTAPGAFRKDGAVPRSTSSSSAN
ncbi:MULTISPECIES: AraC family transcriptional regulator [Streptomyces]|uniref:AraC family transcriptional regulator n=1 Tax=Streptomyces luteosporeus TaxID=173856 RepID=A0ABP6G4S7_9ACTN